MRKINLERKSEIRKKRKVAWQSAENLEMYKQGIIEDEKGTEKRYGVLPSK